MYNHRKERPKQTTLKGCETLEGETMEEKVRRIMNNKEPITDGAPILHIPRNEGVRPDTNIRTDRFELAVDMTDKITSDKLAKRDALYAVKPETGASPDSIGATGSVNP